MDVQPVTLTGRFTRLEPLSLDHVPCLCRVGLDGSIWMWMPVRIRSERDIRKMVEEALAEAERGVSLPFATVDVQTGEVVGSTRYLNIDRLHRRLEIGYTWIAPPWQRTAVNTEAKFLMLRHAFETLACLRVEWKTDSLNVRSREAILRLGAKEEGLFRNHMLMPGGRIRHTAYYSMTFQEWPAAKSNLLGRLSN